MPGLDQLAGNGPAWAIVAVLLFGMAALLAYIARSHSKDRQEWRQDLADERKTCNDRDAKLARGLKRVAVHQRHTNSMMSDISSAFRTLTSEQSDSKKKPWSPHQ
jgi:hypothetical protein